jgi:hypothetical protein
MDDFMAQATTAYHAIDRQHAVATMLSHRKAERKSWHGQYSTRHWWLFASRTHGLKDTVMISLLGVGCVF